MNIKYKAQQALVLLLAGVILAGCLYTLDLKWKMRVSESEIVRLGRAVDVLSGREVKGGCGG